MSKKDEDIQKVLNKFPNNKALKLYEFEELRKTLNFYGLNERDVYENIEEQQVK